MPKSRRAVRKSKRAPAKKRRDVRRDEFDRLVGLANQHGELINEVRHNLEIQFKRMAQIQGELDEAQRSMARLVDQLKR
jgi:hypothetical protein